jgi:hypothetical protein
MNRHAHAPIVWRGRRPCAGSIMQLKAVRWDAMKHAHVVVARSTKDATTSNLGFGGSRNDRKTQATLISYRNLHILFSPLKGISFPV